MKISAAVMATTTMAMRVQARMKTRLCPITLLERLFPRTPQLPTFSNPWCFSPTTDQPSGEASCDTDCEASTTFHQFCFLPAELRFRIYELSIEPRVIELETRRQEAAPNSLYLHSRSSVPPLLHVWRESREILSKFYECTFATKPRPNEEFPVSLPCVYICFSIDTIYLNPCTFGKLFNIYLMMRKDRERIEHLAVDALCIDFLQSTTFPAVKTFTHVLHLQPYVKDTSFIPFNEENRFFQSISSSWQRAWRHNWQLKDRDELPDWQVCRYESESTMKFDAELSLYGFNGERLRMDLNYPLYQLYQ